MDGIFAEKIGIHDNKMPVTFVCIVKQYFKTHHTFQFWLVNTKDLKTRLP